MQFLSFNQSYILCRLIYFKLSCYADPLLVCVKFGCMVRLNVSRLEVEHLQAQQLELSVTCCMA